MLKALFRAAGKTGGRAVAIFALDAEEAATAVRHIVAGKVDLPIYLYSLAAPAPEIARACAQVTVGRSAGALAARAWRELWPFWVALGVAPWTGKAGWPLKILPFLLPPFRPLAMNENRDFFAPGPGSAGNHVWLRCVRRARRWPDRIRPVVRGALALPFAHAAQHSSALSRFVFAGMRGTEKLAISPSRASGEGVAVFEYRDREWERDRIQAFLERAECRWVLFLKQGANAGVEDLLSLMKDERTFAASRQDGVRRWRDVLLPVSSYRQLQPNEATRVLAPLSHCILVDRAKLLALGLPNQSGYGSNWYLLFWRAAAAGWRSYCAGGDEALRETPGLPFYEAQFVHTLLLEPALAKLAPRESALSRGNIARRTRGGAGFRGLPRVLVLSPYLPYPLSHGGAVRMFNLCGALADSVDFVLACFREKGDWTDYDKLHEIFREVYVVAVDEKHRDAKLPVQVSGYESTTMRALIPAICEELRIDILQVEYTQMAAYRETVPHVPAILVEHDVTFTLHRQLAEHGGGAPAQREYWKWLAFESKRLRAFDCVWTMSEHDRAQAMQAGSPAAKTIVVANGVDLERFSADANASGEDVLYVGSFRHRPNYLGFEELRRNVMPAVWQRFPDTKLVVVAGPEHEKYWEGDAKTDSRVEIHGFVKDVAPLYRQCAVVAVPLPISAGTNIKVMEALASGCAVVSTPVGCVGLGLRDGDDVLVRDLGPGFAQGIADLLAAPERRFSMGRRARRTAEERFGWDRIARQAAASYEKLLPAVFAHDGGSQGAAGDAGGGEDQEHHD